MELKDFLKKNWSLYLILIIDILIEYNSVNLTKNLPENTIYYKKIFDSYVFNFIYLLLPFYNIGLKVGQSKENVNKQFTNMIKLHNIIGIFVTIIGYLLRTFYFTKMNVINLDYSFILFFLAIIINSLISCLNGFVTGLNNNWLLIRFNLINLVLNFIVNGIIIYFNLNKKIILYLRLLPNLFNVVYLLYKCRSYFDKSYYFSTKLESINIGFQLIIRNMITLFGLNVNDYIILQLSNKEIKKYEIISSNLGSYLNIYSPLSTIIQRNIYSNRQINKICIIYGLLSLVAINIINYYYWNFNYLLINSYNLLHLTVFINESKNINNNNIMKSTKILIVIFIIKFIFNRLLSVNTINYYYIYINFVLFIKFLLNNLIN